MVSWVKLAKWLRRGPTTAGDGFESWKNSKKFEKKLKNSFFAPISHNYYIYRTSYTFPKQKRWMVKVYQHYHESLVRILRQTRYDSHDEGEVHENREREGGPRTAETWFVSRHYEPRTEVRRGGTPKVRKL